MEGRSALVDPARKRYGVRGSFVASIPASEQSQLMSGRDTGLPDVLGPAYRTPSPEETRIRVETSRDVVVARRIGRELAASIGFSGIDLPVIATAISEVARNIVQYASPGEITAKVVAEQGRRGIVVIACDMGPGIRDIAHALDDGVSSGGGLGIGLGGARRLMDEFEIRSGVGEGTTITMAKWRRP
jgi:serine/threonine-protein kinase RsbT